MAQLADGSYRSLEEIKKTLIGAKYQGGIVFYWIDSTGKHGLIAAEKDLDSTYTWQKAIDKCKTLKLNGYSDWRLPTREELGALYANRNVVRGFANDFYWSSTETGKGIAWLRYFGFGTQNLHIKANTFNVRLSGLFDY